jgi:hypothetical protein
VIRLVREINRDDAEEIIEGLLQDLDAKGLGDLLDFVLMNYGSSADKIDAREVVYRVREAK